ncbi:MAG: hypothetical protein K6C14_06000 [Eubacterium sp.]|nr:hypothetical protein [Eubacterium sp.]
MRIKIDKDILNKIKEENNPSCEAELINAAIDEEFQSPEPDFELIDELSEELLAILNAEADSTLYLSSDDVIGSGDAKKIRVSKILIRILAVAAIIIATTISVNAAYRSATGSGIISGIVNSVEKNVTTEAKETSSTVKKYATTKHNSADSEAFEKTTEKKKTETESSTEDFSINGNIGERVTEATQANSENEPESLPDVSDEEEYGIGAENGGDGTEVSEGD